MSDEYESYWRGVQGDADWDQPQSRAPDGTAHQQGSGSHQSSGGWDDADDSWGNSGGWAHQPPDTYVPGGWNPDPSAGDQRYAGDYGWWGAPPAPSATDWDIAPSHRGRRSLRRLGIALAVLVILLLAGGTAAVFGIQFFGPVGTAGRFCDDLRAQRYSGAYGLLSKPFQAAITEDTFVNDGVTLDQAEGTVLDCTTSGGGGSLNPGFGESNVAVSLSIRRAKMSALAGMAHLVNEDGLWRIGALDISVWGVDLGAVQTMNAYCAALQSQAYSAAYAVLGRQETAGVKAAEYAQLAAWRDQVDGTVGICQIMSVGADNTDAAAGFDVSITRHRLGQKQDTIGLDIEDGAWKISAIGAQLQGTDLGGIQVTARFCDDLSHGRYVDAYGLFSAGATGGASESYIAAQLSGRATGLKWASCTFDASTYKVSGSSASLSVDITFEQLSTGHTYLLSVIMKLARFGHVWKLNAATAQQ